MLYIIQTKDIPSYFQSPHYTYDDYKNWDRDWELIYGFAFSLLPASNRSTKLQLLNSALLSVIFLIHKTSIVRPDLMIVEGNITTDFLTFPPTLILEVASNPLS